MTDPTVDPGRTDLAALSKYARAEGTSHPASDLILGAVEEIATLRRQLDQATAAAAELRALRGVRTAEQHKAEAERLLAEAQRHEHATPALVAISRAHVHATLATIPDMVELIAEAPAGCMPGPTLAPGDRAYPLGWEQDPDLDVCAHAWELVTLHYPPGRTEHVVRCSSCQVPRCGHSTDADPCMERRHHRACHRYLSGRTEHVGGSLLTCGCPTPNHAGPA